MTIPAKLYILMYHRICPHTPDTACYFERGTAVTPDIFCKQLAWLMERMEILSLSAALQRLRTGKLPHPLCVLSFDDGYRDILEYAANVPFTLFPIAAHLADDTELMFVDHYYALIHRAQHREAIKLPCEIFGDAPDIDKNLRWWVRGPLKEHLQTLSVTARKDILHQLAECLDVPNIPANHTVYLSRAELQQLAAQDHEIGGHGYSHQRLICLDAETLEFELDQAYALAAEYQANDSVAFCYPDGAYNPAVIQAVRQVGFSYACTVEPGALSDASGDVFCLPRIFVRNNLFSQSFHE